MRVILLICAAFVFAAMNLSSPALAQSDKLKSASVWVGCVDTSPGLITYAGCVAAGFTGLELETCLKTPKKCFGPNNELRKFFCYIGVGGGCSKPDPIYVKYVFPYKPRGLRKTDPAGCEAVWSTGAIYYSTDCKYLDGGRPPNTGGKTTNAWDVSGVSLSRIRGIVVMNDCVFFAVNNFIYKSCDGLNLAGVTKDGVHTAMCTNCREVAWMDVATISGQSYLRVQFVGDAVGPNSSYCSPDGTYPNGNSGGKGHTIHCDPYRPKFPLGFLALGGPGPGT